MKMRSEVSNGMCNRCFAPHWAHPPELLQPAETNSTSSVALFDLSRKISPARVITNLPVEILGVSPKETVEAP